MKKTYQTIIKGIPYYAIYPDKRPFFTSRNIDIYLMYRIGRTMPLKYRKEAGLTLKDLAKRYSITNERVRQIYLKMGRCIDRNLITIKEGKEDA